MRLRELVGRGAALPLVGALAVGVLLAGCSGNADDDQLPALPFDTVAMPVDRAPTATPGQHLEVGEIALLPQSNYKGVPGDAIETTVLGVVEGEPSYWDVFDNGAGFAGETPFFAVIQYRWVTGSVTAYATPLLRPVLDDGTEGGIVEREYMGSLTANTICPFELERFDLDEDRGPDEYLACVLYTAPKGSTVVGLGWHNLGGMAFSAPDPAVNPFYPAPVVWDVTPVAVSAGD
ncbi:MULTISPECIES: hypothetical protein [unclassified Cryobacterium]|uniref:hypothetical protein n=1 Tax=unclassified Cryobacterium TaxID=2649013 RepID=UPI001068F077|nr:MULTISPECIES: hypothetical protein [unclassified Cryobacterium]TFC59834.1 hypothetical protein E3O60_07025 [Cryobacterium sp. TMB1-7]TFC91403.1 hypothetical protein E3T19_03685 [Cryobacterium sp. TMT4-31]